MSNCIDNTPMTDYTRALRNLTRNLYLLLVNSNQPCKTSVVDSSPPAATYNCCLEILTNRIDNEWGLNFRKDNLVRNVVF